jgi:ElaB/YqjD/DUF883 family membrane-anchored ribosome-binding protein
MKAHATHKQKEHAEDLMEDAKALLAATADVAEEKVVQARQKLNAAIERGKEVWQNVQERTIAGAKATDEAIRENPYKSVALAVGVGAIIGYLLARRK